MEQELSIGIRIKQLSSADGTFLLSPFPNTHSLFATNAKTAGGLKQTIHFKMIKLIQLSRKITLANQLKHLRIFYFNKIHAP